MTVKDIKDYLMRIKKIDTLIRNKRIEERQAERFGINTASIKNGIEHLSKEKELIILLN